MKRLLVLLIGLLLATTCYAGDFEQWTIDQLDGNHSIGSGQLLLPDGSATVPSWGFISSSNWGFYKADASSIGLSIGGVMRYQYYGGVFYMYSDTSAIALGATSDTVLSRVAAATISVPNIWPSIDDTYYLGKLDDDTPFAWKGVVVKDTTNGKYYSIRVTNGAIVVGDLTD